MKTSLFLPQMIVSYITANVCNVISACSKSTPSAASCNADLQSLVPFPDCSASHSPNKTVLLLLNVLPRLFHVLDLVLINAVLHNAPYCVVEGV